MSSESQTLTDILESLVFDTVFLGKFIGLLVTAAISLAIPIIERQSGRFGVISSSITVSGAPHISTKGVPATTSDPNSNNPE